MLFGDKASQIEKLAKKKNSAKLVDFLQDKKPEIRMQAIKALGTIGDDTAINALIGLLQESDPAVRAAVVRSAGFTCRQVVKSHLQHLVQTETDPTVLTAIRETMCNIPNKN